MLSRVRRRGLGIAAILSVVGVANAVQAQDAPPFTPSIMFGRGVSLTPDSWHVNPDGSVTFVGSDTGGTFGTGPSWGLEWDVTAKQDPFIVGTLTITNFTNTTKDYSFLFQLPVTPGFSPSRFGGSLTASLLDKNGDGSAFLDPNATSPSIYRGAIDGSPVLPLFFVNLACFGSGAGCTASGSDSSGLPGVTLPGGAVLANIGTMLNFSLSAGDSVTFTTNFTVEPVPLPAALPLLLLGLGTFGGRRLLSRRRGAIQA